MKGRQSGQPADDTDKQTLPAIPPMFQRLHEPNHKFYERLSSGVLLYGAVLSGLLGGICTRPELHSVRYEVLLGFVL